MYRVSVFQVLETCRLIAVILYGVQFAPAILGTTIALPDIAAPPRIEVFLLLLLLPSAIFITQAGYSNDSPTQALAASCLLITALMILFGLGWVVIDQLLLKHNVRFVALLPGPHHAPRRSNGASGSFILTAKRKSSHGGFLVERDFADQARPSQFGASSMGHLDDDDELDSNAGNDGGISEEPASNTMQLFAEAQGATCHAWGASVGPTRAVNPLPSAVETNAFVSGDRQPARPIAEGFNMTSEQQNVSNVSTGDREEAVALDVAGDDAHYAEVRYFSWTTTYAWIPYQLCIPNRKF